MLSSCVMFEGVLAFLFGASIFSCLNIVIFRMRSVKMQGDISAMCFSVTGVAGGFAALLCLFRWGMSSQGLVAYMFLCILMVTAYVDGKTKRIPNGLIIAAVAAGAASIAVFPEITLGQRGIGILCISIPLLVIALLFPGGIGGGDIKLMAACGIFLGWEGIIQAFVAAIFAAGVYCIGMMLAGKMNRRSQIALGPFLCLGIVIAMLRMN